MFAFNRWRGERTDLQVQHESDTTIVGLGLGELAGVLFHEAPVRLAGVHDALEVVRTQSRLVGASQDTNHQLEVVIPYERNINKRTRVRKAKER